MVRVQRFGEGMGDVGNVSRVRHLPNILDRFLERALVTLESQHIVRALGEDLCGDRGLAAHGVDGHQTAAQFQ
jgi:hypothetical protein